MRADGQNSLGLDGQLIALFVIVLAAAEAAVALAIALNYYHTHVTVDVDRGNELKGYNALVPTLRVGTHWCDASRRRGRGKLRQSESCNRTRSVRECVPTQSVGTR